MKSFRAANLAWLLVGALPACLPAAAQTPDRIATRSGEPVFFVADEMTYDDARSLVTAIGNVEITQGDRILRARQVTYDRNTEIVTATGDVVLLEPSGEVLFADHVELTGDMGDGFVERLRVLLTDDSRFAANFGRRIDGRRTEMRQVVYSPCELCEENPTRAPLWQIKAAEVTHDEVAKDIEYKDAWLEMAGVPVFYTPYFSHPDPTVKRRSGLLAPTFGSDSDLGYMLQIPYYWAIAPNQDLTFAPILMTEEGGVAAGEYRRLFDHGEIDIEGSFGVLDRTHRDGGGPDRNRKNELRGHLRAHGGFDLGENWRTRFDVYRASDDTYLRKLDFDNASTLRSESVTEYFSERSYGSITAAAVQELRDDVDDDATPIVLPHATFRYVSPTGLLGDRWTAQADALALHRGTDEPESRRASVEVGWEMPWRTSGGHLFNLGLSVRGDAYSVNDVVDGGDRRDGFTGRFFPQAELGWRYPLVRTGETTTQYIEPIVSAVLAPTGLNPDRIPNEDSIVVEFDETSLFEPNRFAGLDRVEGGARLSYGVRSGLYWAAGGQAELFLGHSLRSNRVDAFPDGSGLEDKVSDVVGRALVSPAAWLDLLYRFRVDPDDLTLRRSEAGFRAGPSWLRLSADYVQVDEANEDDPLLDRVEQLNATLSAQITPHWSAFVGHRRDIEEDASLEHRIGFGYSDECLVFQVSYTRSFYADEEIDPGDRVLVRLVFKNIGEVQGGYGFGSGRDSDS